MVHLMSHEEAFLLLCNNLSNIGGVITTLVVSAKKNYRMDAFSLALEASFNFHLHMCAQYTDQTCKAQASSSYYKAFSFD